MATPRQPQRANFNKHRPIFLRVLTVFVEYGNVASNIHMQLKEVSKFRIVGLKECVCLPWIKITKARCCHAVHSCVCDVHMLGLHTKRTRMSG